MLKEQTEAVWPGLGWGTDMRSGEGSGGKGWAVFGAVGFRSEAMRALGTYRSHCGEQPRNEEQRRGDG